MLTQRLWQVLGAHPIVVGAVVGFAVGMAGLAAAGGTELGIGSGLIGGVAGGSATAFVSQSDVSTDVTRALVADVISSVAFYLFLVGAYAVTATESDSSVLDVVYGVALTGLILGLGAIPIALISLFLALTGALVTSHVLDLLVATESDEEFRK